MAYYTNQEELINKILSEDVIFEAFCGSQLYGTATPESDEDFVGIYMVPKQILYGINKMEEIDLSTNKSSSKNTSDDKDIKFYSIKKFFQIAQKNGPNAIEMLFTNHKSIVKYNRIWKTICDNSNLFVSKLVFKSMFGYAYTQKHLARTKRDRYLSIERGVEYLTNLVNIGEKKLHTTILEELKNITMNYTNKSGRAREYLENQPIDQVLQSMSDELNRYGHRAKAAMNNTDMDLRYDWKFASHSIRLLVQCIELAETGKLEFPLKRADLIKDIKFGKFGITEVEEMFNDLDDEFNSIKEKSTLRATPDYHGINKLLIGINDEYYF